MIKYIKRPIPVSAIQLTYNSFFEVEEVIRRHTVIRDISATFIEFKTLEGFVTAKLGDWILIGNFSGEIWPVREDIFKANYTELY